MQIGLDEAYAVHLSDMRSAKIKTWILGFGLVILFLLLTRFGGGFLFSIKQTYYLGEIPLQFSYTQIERLAITAICGMLLAASGNIFQCVFRNPMAAPTMLGVNSGVQIAMLVLVVNYGSVIIDMPLFRYKYCYLGGILMFAVVFALGKISSGPGKLNTSDLLLVGIATSTVVGSLVTGYVTGMETTAQSAYMQAMNVGWLKTDIVSIVCLAAVFFVCMIPMWLMRFSFNTLSYTAEESASFGVSAIRLRVITLLCGTVMVIAAMVHCGGVGVAALLVPHISRRIFGAESKKMFLGNLFLGAILLLVCRQVADMLPWMNGEPFPVGYVVNIIAAPVFAFVMGMIKKRGWE